MPIEFICSTCGAKLRVPDGTGGKNVACPKCQAVSVIPGATSAATPPNDSPSPKQEHSDSPDWGNGFRNPYSFSESSNPYQAPPDFGREDTQGIVATGEIVPTRVYMGQLLRESWNLFKTHYGMLWLVLLLLIGSGFIIGIGMSPLNIAIVFFQQTAPAIALIIMQIGFAFLQNLLMTIPVAGGFACLLSIARTGGFSFNDFLTGFRKFVPCATYNILIWLISALPFTIVMDLAGILGVIPTGRLGIRATDEMIIVFGILIVATYLWLLFSSLRLGWGLYIIADRNVSSAEAFRISWDISRGNALTIFATMLVLGVIFILIAVVTLLIGVILLAPYYHAFFTACYLLMSGQNFQGRKTAIELTEE
ncbi:MAG: hypothetical protein FWC50_02405 [Planctomycetaceae bacterium]|nr:hypothetical protein [Planctomycetaceae bacterium]